MGEDDRPATPDDIGRAAAVIATVTLGLAVERLLLSLALGCLFARGVALVVDWVTPGDAYPDLWPLSGVAVILLVAFFVHRLLRRRASTPDGGS